MEELTVFPHSPEASLNSSLRLSTRCNWSLFTFQFNNVYSRHSAAWTFSIHSFHWEVYRTAGEKNGSNLSKENGNQRMKFDTVFSALFALQFDKSTSSSGFDGSWLKGNHWVRIFSVKIGRFVIQRILDYKWQQNTFNYRPSEPCHPQRPLKLSTLRKEKSK